MPDILFPRSNLMYIPSNQILNAFAECLSVSYDLDKYSVRKKTVSHGTKVIVSENEYKTVVYKVEDSLIEICLPYGTDTPDKAEKVLAFLLFLANAGDCFGKNTRLIFRVRDIVDIGIYSTVKGAKYGIDSCLKYLTECRIRYKLCDGEKKSAAPKRIPIVSNVEYHRGMYTVDFLPGISLSNLSSYLILPNEYFSLSHRSSVLLMYICYLARQNIRKIEKDGAFCISNKAVSMRLNLPESDQNRNANKTVKGEIEKSADSINISCGRYFNVTVVSGPLNTVRDFVDHGYLRIEVKGEYREKLLKIYKNTK